MPSVFISYVQENLNQVIKLAQQLSDFRINAWLDKDKIKPGEFWKDSIRKAITSGDSFIACFSKEYNKRTKTYFNEELLLAVEELRLRPKNRIWFIPVRLSECDIPDIPIGAGETLLSIQWVDLYDDWDRGISKIILSILGNFKNKEVMVLGARKGGEHIIAKLWDKTTIVGIYDRNFSEPGIKLAREKGIQTYNGASSQLQEMLSLCRRYPEKTYYVFLPTRDINFINFAIRNINQTGCNNIKLLQMDKDFSDYEPASNLLSLLQ